MAINTRWQTSLGSRPRQKAGKSLKTTSRYAHVLDSEVAAALDAVAKSRKNSRTKKKSDAK